MAENKLTAWDAEAIAVEVVNVRKTKRSGVLCAGSPIMLIIGAFIAVALGTPAVLYVTGVIAFESDSSSAGVDNPDTSGFQTPLYFGKQVEAEFSVLEPCGAHRLPECSLPQDDNPYEGLEWIDGVPYFRDYARYTQYEVVPGREWELRLDMTFSHDVASGLGRIRSAVVRMSAGADKIVSSVEFDTIKNTKFNCLTDSMGSNKNLTGLSYFFDKFLRNPIAVAPTGGNVSSLLVNEEGDVEDAIEEEQIAESDAIVSLKKGSDDANRVRAAVLGAIDESFKPSVSPYEGKINAFLKSEFELSTSFYPSIEVVAKQTPLPAYIVDIPENGTDFFSQTSPRSFDGLNAGALIAQERGKTFAEKFIPKCYAYDGSVLDLGADAKKIGFDIGADCLRTTYDDEQFCNDFFRSFGYKLGDEVSQVCEETALAQDKCPCSCARMIWGIDGSATPPAIPPLKGPDLPKLFALDVGSELANPLTYARGVTHGCHAAGFNIATIDEMYKAIAYYGDSAVEFRPTRSGTPAASRNMNDHAPSGTALWLREDAFLSIPLRVINYGVSGWDLEIVSKGEEVVTSCGTSDASPFPSNSRCIADWVVCDGRSPYFRSSTIGDGSVPTLSNLRPIMPRSRLGGELAMQEVEKDASPNEGDLPLKGITIVPELDTTSGLNPSRMLLEVRDISRRNNTNQNGEICDPTMESHFVQECCSQTGPVLVCRQMIDQLRFTGAAKKENTASGLGCADGEIITRCAKTPRENNVLLSFDFLHSLIGSEIQTKHVVRKWVAAQMNSPHRNNTDSHRAAEAKPWYQHNPNNEARQLFTARQLFWPKPPSSTSCQRYVSFDARMSCIAKKKQRPSVRASLDTLRAKLIKEAKINLLDNLQAEGEGMLNGTQDMLLEWSADFGARLAAKIEDSDVSSGRSNVVTLFDQISETNDLIEQHINISEALDEHLGTVNEFLAQVEELEAMIHEYDKLSKSALRVCRSLELNKYFKPVIRLFSGPLKKMRSSFLQRAAKALENMQDKISSKLQPRLEKAMDANEQAAEALGGILALNERWVIPPLKIGRNCKATDAVAGAILASKTVELTNSFLKAPLDAGEAAAKAISDLAVVANPAAAILDRTREMHESLMALKNTFFGGPFAQVLGFVDRILDYQVKLTVPFFELSPPVRVCAPLPCGIKMCKKRVWGMKVKVPCGVKLCDVCADVQVLVPTFKSFIFSLGDVMDGIAGLADLVLGPLMLVFDAVVDELTDLLGEFISGVLPNSIVEVVKSLTSLDVAAVFGIDVVPELPDPFLNFFPFDSAEKLPFAACNIGTEDQVQGLDEDQEPASTFEFWKSYQTHSCPWGGWMSSLRCSTYEELLCDAPGFSSVGENVPQDHLPLQIRHGLLVDLPYDDYSVTQTPGSTRMIDLDDHSYEWVDEKLWRDGTIPNPQTSILPIFKEIPDTGSESDSCIYRYTVFERQVEQENEKQRSLHFRPAAVRLELTPTSAAPWTDSKPISFFKIGPEPFTDQEIAAKHLEFPDMKIEQFSDDQFFIMNGIVDTIEYDASNAPQRIRVKSFANRIPHLFYLALP